MAYKIHVIPAKDAAAYVAEHDGVALAVFVDDEGNPHRPQWRRFRSDRGQRHAGQSRRL